MAPAKATTIIQATARESVMSSDMARNTDIRKSPDMLTNHDMDMDTMPTGRQRDPTMATMDPEGVQAARITRSAAIARGREASP